MTSDTLRGQKCLWGRLVRPAEMRELRKKYGESAAIFAKRFGISRSYLKQLESGSKPIRQRVARIFAKLESEVSGNEVAIDQAIVVEAKFKLPAHFHLDIRPRACRGHRELHTLKPHQVYCKPARVCRKLYLRRLRRREKQGD